MSTPRGFVEMDMNPGIKKVSKDIDKLVNSCYENHKVAQALCENIGAYLGKAGELTERLSRYMNKINKDYSDYFENNKIAPIVEISQIYESASSMLSEVGMQMKKTSSIFSEDMQYMFEFANYENEGLQRLIELRNSFSESYEDAKINLERKKVILFEQKNLRSWGIDAGKTKISPSDLLNNAVLSKRYMLPQVDISLILGNHKRQKLPRLRRLSQQAVA